MDISLDPLGIFIKISFISGFKRITGVPGRTKCPVAPASAIASVFVIFNTDLEYTVSIVMVVRLLVTIVSHHHLSSCL